MLKFVSCKLSTFSWGAFFFLAFFFGVESGCVAQNPDDPDVAGCSRIRADQPGYSSAETSDSEGRVSPRFFSQAGQQESRREYLQDVGQQLQDLLVPIAQMQEIVERYRRRLPPLGQPLLTLGLIQGFQECIQCLEEAIENAYQQARLAEQRAAEEESGEPSDSDDFAQEEAPSDAEGLYFVSPPPQQDPQIVSHVEQDDAARRRVQIQPPFIEQHFPKILMVLAIFAIMTGLPLV